MHQKNAPVFYFLCLVLIAVISLLAYAFFTRPAPSEVTTSALPTPTHRVRTPGVTPQASQTTTAPTATPGINPTPVPTGNWLANGTFPNKDFSGWDDVNGYWRNALHGPVPCGSYAGGWLQMDTLDGNGLNGWPLPVPKEDWAWTEFQAPFIPSVLNLSYHEIHHVNNSVIKMRIYGYVGEIDEEWELVYEKIGVSSPSGKCSSGPPKLVSVSIPLSKAYTTFRLEIYGKINAKSDAVLWGNFRIAGQ